MKDFGTHILIDLYDVEESLLTNKLFIQDTICNSAIKAKANIIHKYFHKFGGFGGVTGLVALKESHISIHTWPENKFASVDIYMCGNAKPIIAMEHVKKEFNTLNFSVKLIKRGN